MTKEKMKKEYNGPALLIIDCLAGELFRPKRKPKTCIFSIKSVLAQNMFRVFQLLKQF